MRTNEMINIKSRFKTLKDINVHHKVACEGQRMALKDLMLSVKHQGTNLFLAVEKGSRKGSKDMNVVLNHKVKQKL